MISTLRGTVLHAAGGRIVLEVNGVGFSVLVPPQLAMGTHLGAELLVNTALIVREDELSLVGFATIDELEVFELLRGVSGVGPKSALGVLSAMTPDAVAAAVANEEDAAFRKVSGIGPKTAKLIVLQLQGKFTVHAAPSSASPVVDTVERDVLSALEGLGWPERVAAEAVDAVREPGLDAGALLRAALAQLGPRA